MNIIESKAFTDERMVEVVRCKDCKYGGDRVSSFWRGRIVCNRRKTVDYVTPDDFCSYGERRKDNATD